MTFMSPNRLVSRRWFGLPFTLLKSIGQPPSKCFCSPVSSRSGSTVLLVTMRSPSALSHSSVSRKLDGRVTTFKSFLRTAFCIARCSLSRCSDRGSFVRRRLFHLGAGLLHHCRPFRNLGLDISLEFLGRV